MNAPTNTHGNLATVQLQAAEDAQTAETALALIKATPVTTPEMYTAAGEELKEIKGEIKRVEAVRDEHTKDMRDAIASNKKAIAKIDALFARALTPLFEAERIRKEGIAGYLQAKAISDRQALEATRAAVLSGDGAAAAAALATVMPEAPKVQGVSAYDLWGDYEVEDLSKIPPQFMAPNDKAIRAYLKATKQADAIPGIRGTPKKVISAGSK